MWQSDCAHDGLNIYRIKVKSLSNNRGNHWVYGPEFRSVRHNRVYTNVSEAAVLVLTARLTQSCFMSCVSIQ